MPSQTAPGAFKSALTGWRVAFAAILEMPAVFGWAMAATLGLGVLGLPFVSDQPETSSFAKDLMSLLFGIAQGFLLTPVALAVHRYVLLGEMTERYGLNPNQPRFYRFFIFSLAFQLLMVVPGLLFTITTRLSGLAAFVFGLAATLAFVAGVIVSLRTLILFPAIAVDAPGADWRNAMQDTKGHSWSVLGVMLVTALPLLVVELPLYSYFLLPSGPRSLVGTIVFALLQAVLTVLSIAAFAAVASLLFRALGERLAGRAL